jgi:aspartate carbamoyltransferase regulatory subunit
MTIDSIENGIVIDHISAGKSTEIYNYLALRELDSQVAIIKNAKSDKKGKKDIIKIENEININFDILGYVDPDITVNIIEKGLLKEKKNMSLPDMIIDVISCKNPRCITTTEPGISQKFFLANKEKRAYRCVYCEQEG